MDTIILAGILGAAVLAICLLALQVRRNTSRINQLRAEIAGLQLTRITRNNGDGDGGTPPTPPETRRRKGHLGLVVGGSVAAAATALGRTVRNTWQQNPGASVVTVTAAAAIAATIYAGVWSGEDDPGPRTPAAPAPTAGEQPGPSLTPSPTASQSRPDTPTPTPPTSRPGPDGPPPSDLVLAGATNTASAPPPDTTTPDPGDNEQSPTAQPEPPLPSGSEDETSPDPETTDRWPPRLLCVGLSARPVLDLELCLL